MTGMRFANEAAFDGKVSTPALDLANTVLSSGTLTVEVSSPVLFSSFNAAAYRGAEYFLQMSQGNKHAITKFLVVHDGVDNAISEYGFVNVGDPILYEFFGSFSLGNLELTVTFSEATSTPVTMKHSRVLFDI